jgi:hypothetical protein
MSYHFRGSYRLTSQELQRATPEICLPAIAAGSLAPVFSPLVKRIQGLKDSGGRNDPGYAV